MEILEGPRDNEGFVTLKKTYSELYKKTNYLTTRQMVIDRITEYDIKSANTSALRASGKVDKKILDMLDSLDKQAREETVGKMIRKGKNDPSKVDIWKLISKGITSAKEKLFRYNSLQDENILSIKNDAVFVIGPKLKQTTFGAFTFRPKHQYAAYLNIEKVEFYYDSRHNDITVKGISDEVISNRDHQNGMMLFFKKVFKFLVNDETESLRKYLIDFVRQYKAKELPHQYYRELNSDNIYRTIIEIAQFEYNMDEIGDEDMDIVNPIYNYNKFILPMIRLFM